MSRVNRSLDKPMFEKPNAEPPSYEQHDVMLCAKDSPRVPKLLNLIPTRTVKIETDLACALRACLENRVSKLLVDMASFGPTALSCLAHLRLMRPQQEIVLVQGAENTMHLDRTLFGDVPVLSVQWDFTGSPKAAPVRVAVR